MNKQMPWIILKDRIPTDIHRPSTSLGETTQISVGEMTIMHNLHNYLPHIRIFKISRVTHLMSHHQEKLLKIHRVHLLKNKSLSITEQCKP